MKKKTSSVEIYQTSLEVTSFFSGKLFSSLKLLRIVQPLAEAQKTALFTPSGTQT
jgi:hypothetical protein